ncbi:MAG: CoB--CoM heterodisulfide reductase iron-sulfur subunit A family protein [Promethearchaeota archaeon]|nr:MAG: CoB--CoM heterodisulfide reductase iron-sulfur subunit A family protein [Candidatus Lokiarchaeota archaeon]
MSEEEEEIRIGVFVCHCGSNIGGYIDCKSIAEWAKSLPHVVFTQDNLYTCSETGLAQIKKGVNENNLNRVIVASCTPRTHEPLFRSCIQEEGVNPYLFNFVNIRDQNTWVHQKEPEKAFEKAKELIAMGVAKAAKLEPLEKIIVDTTPTALVIGAGVAGITAALSMANQGFETHLVEKEAEIGGKLNILDKLYPTNQDASELLKSLKKRVNDNTNLTVYTSASVKSIEGFIGNFEIEIEQNGNVKELTIGVIIVAVGASLFTPTGLFNYDGQKRITQAELETLLKNNQVESSNVVMIQCVGSRIEERKYCSSVCCMVALKNALEIKERNPKANVTILFRDLYTPGTYYEDYYRRAREAGVIFIEYAPEKMPIVEDNQVRVHNEYLGQDILIPYDLVVLSTPLVSNEDNKDIAQMLKVPLEENGFFLEAHVKLRPMDFATDGVYICGSAKWPVDITESIAQGYAAASRASTIISHSTLEVEGATSSLPEYNRNLCTGCEVCITVCPYKAISKDENDEILIQQVLCKGCGVCGATCTNHAIVIRHFTDDQILSEILAFGGQYDGV